MIFVLQRTEYGNNLISKAAFKYVKSLISRVKEQHFNTVVQMCRHTAHSVTHALTFTLYSQQIYVRLQSSSPKLH